MARRLYGRTRIVIGSLLLLALIASPFALVNQYCFNPFHLIPFPNVRSYPIPCGVYLLLIAALGAIAMTYAVIGAGVLLLFLGGLILDVCILRGIREEQSVKGDEAV